MAKYKTTCTAKNTTATELQQLSNVFGNKALIEYEDETIRITHPSGLKYSISICRFNTFCELYGIREAFDMLMRESLKGEDKIATENCAEKQNKNTNEDYHFVEGETPKCPERFESRLLRPLHKFEVEYSEHNLLPVGTIGYIIMSQPELIDGVIILQDVLITRKGKTGKNRLDCGNVFSPVFFSEKHNVGTNINHRNKFAVLKDISSCKNLLSLNKLEFLEWAYVVHNYLKKIVNGIPGATLWPNLKKNPLNTIYGIVDSYINYGEDILDKYITNAFRQLFIKNVRIVKGSLVKKEFSLERIYKENYEAEAANHIYEAAYYNNFRYATQECVQATVEHYN